MSRCLRSSGTPSYGVLPRLSQRTSTRSSTSSFAPSPVPSFRNRSTVHVAWSRLRAGSRRLICTRWLRKLLELLHGFIDLGLLTVGDVWIRWTLIRLPGAHELAQRVFHRSVAADAARSQKLLRSL